MPPQGQKPIPPPAQRPPPVLRAHRRHDAFQHLKDSQITSLDGIPPPSPRQGPEGTGPSAPPPKTASPPLGRIGATALSPAWRTNSQSAPSASGQRRRGTSPWCTSISAGYLRCQPGRLTDCDFWSAHYPNADSMYPTMYYNYHIWQYSDHGNVNGIDGRADMNIACKRWQWDHRKRASSYRSRPFFVQTAKIIPPKIPQPLRALRRPPSAETPRQPRSPVTPSAGCGDPGAPSAKTSQ